MAEAGSPAVRVRSSPSCTRPVNPGQRMRWKPGHGERLVPDSWAHTSQPWWVEGRTKRQGQPLQGASILEAGAESHLTTLPPPHPPPCHMTTLRAHPPHPAPASPSSPSSPSPPCTCLTLLTLHLPHPPYPPHPPRPVPASLSSPHSWPCRMLSQWKF